MKKKVIFDPTADKELEDLPREVLLEVRAIVNVLEKHGVLREPVGKKMSGYKNLYEVRIRKNGQWRGFYAYLINDCIVILHFINKKRQKTPKNAIATALNRLKKYK